MQETRFDGQNNTLTFVQAVMDLTAPAPGTGCHRSLRCPGKRLAVAPDMPTVAQAGMPEYEATGWNGVPAPANTPRPIVDKFDKTAVEALKTPEIEKLLMEQGLEPAGNSPQQFARSMHGNMEKWLRATREAGIRVRSPLRGITHMWIFLFALGWAITLVVT